MLVQQGLCLAVDWLVSGQGYTQACAVPCDAMLQCGVCGSLLHDVLPAQAAALVHCLSRGHRHVAMILYLATLVLMGTLCWAPSALLREVWSLMVLLPASAGLHCCALVALCS